MKKIYLIFTLFLFAFLGTATTSDAQEFNFGVKTGLNLSELKTSDEFYVFTNRINPHIGLFLRGRFKSIALQSEILVSRSSADRWYFIREQFPQSRYRERFAFISIPVLAKVYFLDFIHVSAGPQFNLIHKVTRKPDMVFSFQAASYDVTNEYFPTDMALTFGTGVDLRIGLSAEIRYIYGIQNMYNVTSGEERRLNVIQLSFGYNFLR